MIVEHSSHTTAAFASAFVASSWPTCCAVCPDLTGLSIAAPATPTLTAATRTWEDLRSALALVRTRARHAEYDRDVRHWVDAVFRISRSATGI